jgi:hypothetical protein
MRHLLVGLLVLAPSVASALPPVQPGFTLQSLQNVTATVPRAAAVQLAESALWRDAFIRCSDPIRLTDPKVEPGMNGADPYLKVTARFQCGLTNTPDLATHLAGARHVIVGHVVSVKPAGIKEAISEHMANWQIATSEVRESFKGGATAGTKLAVYFAASTDVMWFGKPRFLAGQDGIWVLQNGTPGLMAPEQLDFHPLDHHNTIWSLLNP